MMRKTDVKSRLEEIYGINRRFLDLLALKAEKHKDPYGLPAEVCRRVAKLSPSQRDAVARVPVLLVTATQRSIAHARVVNDREDTIGTTYEGNEVAEQNFSAALMTWLSQDRQQRHNLASLWLGIPGVEGESITGLGFSDIQDLAPHAGTILRARFRGRPGVWDELIEAARSKNSKRSLLARLAVLPHSFPLQRGTRSVPGSKHRR